MGSIINTDLKIGIKIQELDALDIHQDTVKAIINSDKTGIVRALFQNKLNDSIDELFPEGSPKDYAKAYGRPSLKKLSFGGSENDGYPYKPGHSPQCDGRITYKATIYNPEPHMCWCEWIGYKNKL